MLEAYVIAELSAILRDGYYHLHGRGLSAEAEREINKLAQSILPPLDNYFASRLGVNELGAAVENYKKELEKLGADKGSNDRDYLELTQKHNALLEQNKKLKELLKSLL